MPKITLNTVMPTRFHLEMPTRYCVPFIVTRKSGGKEQFIVIMTPESVIYFDTSDGDLTYSTTEGHLAKEYDFVRFLNSGESFTFTK